MYRSLRVLPKNHLSFLLGKLAGCPVPRLVRRPVLSCVASLLGISESESERAFCEYGSVQELFSRRLKPGLRPTQGRLVSPVDGVLRDCGLIQKDGAWLVKGERYSLDVLLAQSGLKLEFAGGTFFNFYLRPCDYHRVHAPCELQIKSRIYVPGKLWPVNAWAFDSVPNLFAVNERVVVNFNSEFGPGVLVMVGAFNVGQMSLSFDTLRTNSTFSTSARLPQRVEYASAPRLPISAEFGTFHLGSTVLLFFKEQVSLAQAQEKEVRVGENLLAIP